MIYYDHKTMYNVSMLGYTINIKKCSTFLLKLVYFIIIITKKFYWEQYTDETLYNSEQLQ